MKNRPQPLQVGVQPHHRVRVLGGNALATAILDGLAEPRVRIVVSSDQIRGLGIPSPPPQLRRDEAVPPLMSEKNREAGGTKVESCR